MSALTGRRVLVTGASGAFGRAMLRRLAAGGARVVGLDRDTESLAGVLACDIADEPQVRAAVARAVEELGGIDVLINNAGIGTASLMEQGPGEEERAVLDVNLSGSWNVTAAALPHLVRARGHVINVASLLAVVPMPYTGAYAASKRGIVALSDTLRLEHRGIVAVTTVYPGYAATPIHTPAELRSGKTLKGLVPEETPEHVARAVHRAIRRRPRDIATTPMGAIVLRVARAAPGLLEAALARRLAAHGLLPAADRSAAVARGATISSTPASPGR